MWLDARGVGEDLDAPARRGRGSRGAGRADDPQHGLAAQRAPHRRHDLRARARARRRDWAGGRSSREEDRVRAVPGSGSAIGGQGHPEGVDPHPWRDSGRDLLDPGRVSPAVHLNELGGSPGAPLESPPAPPVDSLAPARRPPRGRSPDLVLGEDDRHPRRGGATPKSSRPRPRRRRTPVLRSPRSIRPGGPRRGSRRATAKAATPICPPSGRGEPAIAGPPTPTSAGRRSGRRSPARQGSPQPRPGRGASPKVPTTVTSWSLLRPRSSACRSLGMAPSPSACGTIGTTSRILIASLAYVARGLIRRRGRPRPRPRLRRPARIRGRPSGREVRGPLRRGPAVCSRRSGSPISSSIARQGRSTSPCGTRMPVESRDQVGVAAEPRPDHRLARAHRPRRRWTPAAPATAMALRRTSHGPRRPSQQHGGRR